MAETEIKSINNKTLCDSKARTSLANKLDKNQGSSNNGKLLSVGSNGDIELINASNIGIGGDGIVSKSLELIIDYSVEEQATKYIFTKEEYPKIENITCFYLKIDQGQSSTSPIWCKLSINGTDVCSTSASFRIISMKGTAINGFWSCESFSSDNSNYYFSNTGIQFLVGNDISYLMKYEKINKIEFYSYNDKFLEVGTNIKIYGC